MLDSEMLRDMLLWPPVLTLVVLSPLLSRRFRTSPSRVGALVAASVFIGVCVAFAGIVGSPFDPLTMDAKARLPLVALLGLVGAGLALTTAWKLRALTALVLGLGSMRLVLGTVVEFQWSTGESLLYVGLFGGALAGVFLSTDRVLADVSPKFGAVILALVAGLPAPFMLFADSLVLAQLHLALGVVTGLVSLGVLVGVLPSIATARYVVVGVASSLWVIALRFANVEVLAFGLLALGLPLAALLSLRSASLSQPKRSLLPVAGLIVPIAAALVLGLIRYQADAVAAPGDDMSYGYQ